MKKFTKIIAVILFAIMISLKIIDTNYIAVRAEEKSGFTLDEKERILQEKDEEAKRNAVVVPDGSIVNRMKIFSNNKKYTSRISGEDRVLTAIEVSKTAYKNKSETVVIAAHRGNADALTGTLLASMENAPLLLVKNTGASEELKEEIQRLGASKAFILGGEQVVPISISEELEEMGLITERIAGINRYETAGLLAQKVDSSKHIFLTLGRNTLPGGKDDALADALAVGPVSAKNKSSVLLTKKNYLPQETIDTILDLEITNVTVVGGENAISSKVRNELRDMNLIVNEIDGPNRYATAIKIAETYFYDLSNFVVASGKEDADALVGGYFGALKNSPVILVHPDKNLPEISNYFEKFKNHTYILGGESVVSSNISANIENILKKPMVCLDYGHGGIDSGATYKGRLEKDDVLRTGKLLAAKLRSKGVRVDETRVADVTLKLEERVYFANKKDYDYFVSFHRNAYKPEHAHGVETYVYPGSSSRSLALARKIQRNLIDEKVGFYDRKVKKAKFYVLGNTKAPAVLMEVGFLDNTIDNDIYDSKQVEIVDAISSAILEALDE